MDFEIIGTIKEDNSQVLLEILKRGLTHRISFLYGNGSKKSIRKLLMQKQQSHPEYNFTVKYR